MTGRGAREDDAQSVVPEPRAAPARAPQWSTWACRLAPVPWMIGAVVFSRLSKRNDSLGAAACLVLCFAALGLAVIGLFGLLRFHAHAGSGGARPSKSTILLAVLGIVGGMVTAMASMLLSELAER